MELFLKLNRSIYDILWGPPMLILLVGCGIFLTIRTRFLAFRKFGFIIKNTLFKMFEKGSHGEGDVSPFQALSTALAATVGTGNIVGVAGAILVGGPGAVFWMWLAALFGMTTKMCEATLAVSYREIDSTGTIAGGPMYYIEKGLKQKWLAKVFAFFGALATFGIGNTVQSNSIANTLSETFNVPTTATGIVVSILVFIVIIGGIKHIGSFTEKLVPLMAGFYILGAIAVIFIHRQNIPAAFASIFKEAFQMKSAAGGFAGYTMMFALKNGVARGVFTNEAGLGSSPIAHAAATTDHPIRQGIWGVFEVFVDTMVVCTLTALVILTTGVWTAHAHDANFAATLSAESFASGFPLGKYIVSIGLVLFAFSTILGWEYYGETCAKYLLGDGFGKIYRIIFVPLVFVGAVIELDVVWAVADNLNGFMAIPNLIALISLSSVVVRLERDFFSDPDRIRVNSEEWESLLEEESHEPKTNPKISGIPNK